MKWTGTTKDRVSLWVPVGTNPFRMALIAPHSSDDMIGVGIFLSKTQLENARSGGDVTKGLFLTFENEDGLDVLEDSLLQCLGRMSVLEGTLPEIEEPDPRLLEALEDMEVTLVFGHGSLLIGQIAEHDVAVGIGITVTDTPRPVGEDCRDDDSKYPTIFLTFDKKRTIKDLLGLLKQCRASLRARKTPAESLP